MKRLAIILIVLIVVGCGLYFLDQYWIHRWDSVIAREAARYRVDPRLQFFGQINNLLDRKYYTAALLGPTGFTSDGAFVARPLPAIAGEFPLQHATFYAPGAPRTFWIGLRYQFDSPVHSK